MAYGSIGIRKQGIYLTMSNKQISDKELFRFNWPPKMPSLKPKERKKYEHWAVVVSQSDPDIAYMLQFTSEKKARDHVRSALEANNKVVAKYEKRELPVVTEEGFEK